MKKMIFTALFIGMFSISAFASEFCNEFERGYITGYKQSSSSSYDPYTPYQRYKGYKDPESDYESRIHNRV